MGVCAASQLCRSLCRRSLHNGGVLVHGLNLIREPGGHSRPCRNKYFCRHPACRRACFCRRSDCGRVRRDSPLSLAHSVPAERNVRRGGTPRWGPPEALGPVISRKDPCPKIDLDTNQRRRSGFKAASKASVYSNPMIFLRSIPWRSYSSVVGSPSMPPNFFVMSSVATASG